LYIVNINKFEVDYYSKLQEVIELWYYRLEDTVFLFKCYWYNTDREIRIDSHHGLVVIIKRDRFYNINDIFVFIKQCQQVYYTYTPSFRKDHNRVDYLSIVKTKFRSCV